MLSQQYNKLLTNTCGDKTIYCDNFDKLQTSIEWENNEKVIYGVKITNLKTSLVLGINITTFDFQMAINPQI